MKFLRISYPDIAMHTCSVMLHVFGFCALLGYIAGMPVWTWPLSLLCLLICFYCGYYFELGYRQRRWTEFRYGGEKMPKRIFDFVKWRERRDRNKENKKCLNCDKLFCPEKPGQEFCSIQCWLDTQGRQNLTQPLECVNGCHYKPGSQYCYYGNCTDGTSCALENERKESTAQTLGDA